MTRAQVEFTRGAINEARAARVWYSERSSLAEAGFAAELERTLDEIATTPERFAPYLCGTRRGRLRRFPYLIVFRLNHGVVQVIAVAHAHRRPGYWRRRLT
jgi:plasmid stabilization system protein ParE